MAGVGGTPRESLLEDVGQGTGAAARSAQVYIMCLINSLVV